MATVSYDRVTCQYPGAESPSVSELSLDIADGEFLVLVGPSGCGKSTTLRMLAGLEDVTDVDPRDRDIAMVFQNYALYPHMTVAENMGFALKIAKVPADERRAKVEEAAEILDLTEYLDRKPKNLSGGQRQRVAMGRAIVRSPKVFLMDEPLSNLDAKLRVQTRTQIASLTRRLGVTTVYVTHDQTEAMTMGDRVAVLKAGKLMQVDSPANLYDRPANEFVAGFIGSPAMNLVRSAPDADGVLSLGTTRVQLTPAQREALSGTEVTVGIRPEDLSLAPEGEGLPVSVQAVEELGADAYIYSSLAPVTAANTVVTTHSSAAEEEIAEEDQATEGITIRTGGRSAVKVGDTIWTVPAVDRLHLFDTATGQRLPDAR